MSWNVLESFRGFSFSSQLAGDLSDKLMCEHTLYLYWFTSDDGLCFSNKHSK